MKKQKFVYWLGEYDYDNNTQPIFRATPDVADNPGECEYCTVVDCDEPIGSAGDELTEARALELAGDASWGF